MPGCVMRHKRFSRDPPHDSRPFREIPTRFPARPLLAMSPTFRLLSAVALVLLLGAPTRTQAAELSLFDAHIHYNHDAWEVVSPREAIAFLRQAGVLRALVSSSSDDGTQKLYAEAPDLIVPELRPYRKNGETSRWLRDESLPGYLEERLKRYRYVAIGEFHVTGVDADLPVVRAVVRLAKQHGLCCTLTRMPMRWSVYSARTRRRGSSGPMPATRSRHACGRCCGVIGTSGRNSRPVTMSPLMAKLRESGGPSCSNFPTGSWWARTRSLPSAGA